MNRSDSIISEQMWYNMFGHAAYQIVVMMLLYFDQGAALLRCEPAHRPHHGGCGGADFSKHHSALFNCFVMMTLFNEINCRKLHGETNVFEGVLKNPYFCSIWGVTMLIQVVGVQCAGGLLAVHKDGITSWQWVVCILFGAGELLWQKVFLTKVSTTMPGFEGDHLFVGHQLRAPGHKGARRRGALRVPRGGPAQVRLREDRAPRLRPRQHAVHHVLAALGAEHVLAAPPPAEVRGPALGRLGEEPLHVSYAAPRRRRRRKSHSVPSTGRPFSRRGEKCAFETRDQPTAAAARSTYASPCA